MVAHAALDIRVPSDVQQIEAIVAQVVLRCREHRFDGRQLSLNVPVALTEALSNAILRGNGEDFAKQVRVRAEVSELRLVLEVEDEGDGMDEDHRSYALDPFYTTTGRGRLGLGLTLTAARV